MKKFGFGKKKDQAGDSRPSQKGTVGNPSVTAAANPYAQASSSDPYSNQNTSTSAPPPPYQAADGGRSSGYPSEKNGPLTGGYGSSRPMDNRFGAPPQQDQSSNTPLPGSNNRFGAPSADGNRYAGGYGQGSAYGQSGYGNFANANEQGVRDQLFGGARPQGPGDAMAGSNNGPRGPSDWESGRGANYGSANNSYGGSQERELTAEEQEEEDITATKQEMRFLKQQDVSSTRNALRIAAQAEETGRSALERLGAQGEAIHNTERNLDLASNQNKLAQEKARELKTLNRSMFAVHVSNPFTSNRRIAEREQRVLDDAARDRNERETNRAQVWGNASRQQEYGKQLDKLGGVKKNTKAGLAERSKYQFEADSDDEQMEDEIDQNLDLLHGSAKRLNHLAGAIGREVEIQNQHLARIGGKVDKVDDEIAINRSRLDRIK